MMFALENISKDGRRITLSYELQGVPIIIEMTANQVTFYYDGYELGAFEWYQRYDSIDTVRVVDDGLVEANIWLHDGSRCVLGIERAEDEFAFEILEDSDYEMVEQRHVTDFDLSIWFAWREQDLFLGGVMVARSPVKR